MAKTDEILSEIREVKSDVKHLRCRLYDEDGDIPEIKERLQRNGELLSKHDKYLAVHHEKIDNLATLHNKDIKSIKNNRLPKLDWRILLFGGGGGGSFIALITKLLELW